MAYTLESYSVLGPMLASGWPKKDIVLGISEMEIDLMRYSKICNTVNIRNLDRWLSCSSKTGQHSTHFMKDFTTRGTRESHPVHVQSLSDNPGMQANILQANSYDQDEFPTSVYLSTTLNPGFPSSTPAFSGFKVLRLTLRPFLR